MNATPTSGSSFPALQLTGRSLRNVFAVAPAFLIVTGLAVMFILSPEHGPADLTAIALLVASLLFLLLILRALRPKTLTIDEQGVRYVWEKKVKFDLYWSGIRGIFLYNLETSPGTSAKTLAFVKGADFHTVKEGEIKGSDIERAFTHLQGIAPQLAGEPIIARCEGEGEARELMQDISRQTSVIRQ